MRCNPELQIAQVKLQIDWVVNWIDHDVLFVKERVPYGGWESTLKFFKTSIAGISKQKIYRSQQPPLPSSLYL